MENKINDLNDKLSKCIYYQRVCTEMSKQIHKQYKQEHIFDFDNDKEEDDFYNTLANYRDAKRFAAKMDDTFYQHYKEGQYLEPIDLFGVLSNIEYEIDEELEVYKSVIEGNYKKKNCSTDSEC